MAPGDCPLGKLTFMERSETAWSEQLSRLQDLPLHFSDADMMKSEGPRWYAVQTRPGRERLALQHLEHQHFATYCPWRRRATQVGQRNHDGLRAFFPGYLFVRFDPARDRWRSVNGTIGVIGLVGTAPRNGAPPSPVPPGLIERMQDLRIAGAAAYQDELVTGDPVRVVGGAFDQLLGVLESSTDAERVTILLTFLSQERRVTLDRRLLIAA